MSLPVWGGGLWLYEQGTPEAHIFAVNLIWKF